MLLVGVFQKTGTRGRRYLFTVGVLNEGCERVGYVRCMPAMGALVQYRGRHGDGLKASITIYSM